jgi:hypothetical protein
MSTSTPELDVEKTVTVNKPSDHFSELLYVGVIVLLLSFITLMSKWHNDSMVSEAGKWVFLLIGALTQASTGGVKR